jgi:2-succinyl-5-enolpyruvyl-6-hydroxy-3-cyclohexene-1-carboxylate synthase
VDQVRVNSGLPWAERGVLVCGDGDHDPVSLIELAAQAGWPVLAEPSSTRGWPARWEAISI